MNDGSAAVTVIAVDEQSSPAVALERWADLAEQVLAAEEIPGPAELNLTFIGLADMAEMNAAHMGGSGPTDVLSFPLDPFPDADSVGVPVERLMGDVVICPEVVQKQASGSFDDEMALMVVHGVLHVLGHDHAEPAETAVMKAAEARHLDVWRERGTA